MDRRMSRRRKVYEGKAKVLFEGPEPGHADPVLQGRRHRLQQSEAGRDHRQGRAQQPDLRVPHAAAGGDRHPDPLRAPPEHARAADQGGRDHPARGGGPQRGRGLARQALPHGRRHRRCRARSSSTTTSPTSSGDPMVSEEHITAFGWASYQDIDEILNLSLRINDFLTGLFAGVGLRLIDFKLEYGRLWEDDDMRIVLADEISPDSCRLWDVVTNEKLDKDRFRRDLGRVEEGYQEVAGASAFCPRPDRAISRAPKRSNETGASPGARTFHEGAGSRSAQGRRARSARRGDRTGARPARLRGRRLGPSGQADRARARPEPTAPRRKPRSGRCASSCLPIR